MVFFSHIDMNQPWVHMCSPIQNPALTFLPPPSLGLSQSTSSEYPDSCIQLALVISFIYGIIHVSMLFSQIIPPSPSPTYSKSLFLYLCLFCCLACRITVTFFLKSIYIINIVYWWFSFWFSSLCIIGSSFIHLIRTDSNAGKTSHPYAKEWN